MADSLPAPLPISVLTGFLGSGKTTLLNHLLRSPAFQGCLVLVNEFGEIGIDHLLVRHAAEELVLLESGCVCCSLRGDLVAQLGALLEQRDAGSVPHFKRVVLETTGLADPAPIVQTLLSHPLLSARLYLDGILCTVDAEHGERTLRQHDESARQLIAADRVVVTKADRVDATTLARVCELVRELNPVAELRTTAHGELDPTFAVGMAHLDTRTLLERRAPALHGPAHGHGHGIHAVRSLAVTLERPVNFRSFSLWVAMLTQLQGERIVRLKAVVSAEGEPNPIAVQAVQHVVYPPLDLPSGRDLHGKSYIVILTKGLDDAALAELRESLLAL